MDRLIKDIIENTRVNNVLETNGFKYVGQLLVIHEHSLLKCPGIGKEAINVIASSLYSNRCGCIGSRQAHELPAIVLRHMADRAEAKDDARRRKNLAELIAKNIDSFVSENDDSFVEEHGCTLNELIAKNIDSFGEDVN